jgi:CubicO group peptidase (beta-lactamase class C family)
MLDAYGWRDKAAGVAMTTDTIFNIASMTKPMTTVGALMLYEQGKILIDDPLSKYFPKFASMRVAVRDANGEPTAETVPANRQITIQDLMRHTSGLIYGGRGNTLVHKMYPAGSGDASRDYDGAASLTSSRRCRCCISPRPPGITASASTCSASPSRRSASSRSGNICRPICSRRSE